jgi:5-dehydro-2-deoxygluconokinase
MTLDLLTVGRVSVDLYADAAGAGFVDEQRFVKSIGGTATNVAVAAARLGRHSAVLTRVGADPFGDYVIAKLESFGVDTTFVGRDAALRTPLAFAAMTPPEDPTLLFYRAPKAPDMGLQPGDVDDATVDDVGVLWVAGSAMAEEPARSTVIAIRRDAPGERTPCSTSTTARCCGPTRRPPLP